VEGIAVDVNGRIRWISRENQAKVPQSIRFWLPQ